MAKKQEEVPVESRPWEDLTADEKIERTRLVIKQTQVAVGKLRQEQGDAGRSFERHTHLPDGSAALPVSQIRSGGNLGCCDSAGPNHKPWF